MTCDVLVRGAGFAGRTVARRLRDAGVDARIYDPHPTSPSIGVVLPGWSEHPHRLESGLGTREAGALIAFLTQALDTLPLDRTGVDVHIDPREADDLAPALAAAARIGLTATPTPEGYRLDGGWLDKPPLPLPDILPEPIPAEVEVIATGPEPGDPWLADKIMPVRRQSAVFDHPVLPRPIVTQQYSVSWGGGLVATGARWATPHLEVGETEPVPEPRVTAMLQRLTAQAFPTAIFRRTYAGITGESCDGLPLLGPLPGRPRVVACLGFGGFGLLAAWAGANAVADGLLGVSGPPVPRCLRVTRFV